MIPTAFADQTTSGRDIGLQSESRGFPEEEEAIAAEDRSQLGDGLAQLPERQRMVVTLRDVHGLSSDEVCSLLSLSAANQRVLLHRGRSQLRGLLEVHYATGESVMGT